MADPGEGPVWPFPTLFLDQAEARGAEKELFLRPAPHLISCSVWMTAPPPPYLKVWIGHCNILVSRINSLIPRLTLEAKQLVSVWVFQIEFVYFYYYYYHYYYYFLFLARDQREPTTHVNKQAKQLINAANTTLIVLWSGFLF